VRRGIHDRGGRRVGKLMFSSESGSRHPLHRVKSGSGQGEEAKPMYLVRSMDRLGHNHAQVQVLLLVRQRSTMDPEHLTVDPLGTRGLGFNCRPVSVGRCLVLKEQSLPLAVVALKVEMQVEWKSRLFPPFASVGVRI